MTIDPSRTRSRLLDRHEPRWRQRGYKLVRDPGEALLPDFLEGVRPDAIAVGRTPSLAIMLAAHDSRSRADRLRVLLEGRDDWRLEVIVELPDGPLLAPQDPNAVDAALARATALAEHDPAAGLLMAWAALEAAGRILEPSLAFRSLSTGALIDLMVSQGHVDQEDGDRMRPLADLRNRVAHGQLDARPTKNDVAIVSALGSAILSSETVAGLASARA